MSNDELTIEKTSSNRKSHNRCSLQVANLEKEELLVRREIGR